MTTPALDSDSIARLDRRWPNGCDELALALPAHGFVIRTEDAWFQAKHSEGSWLRAVDLARAASGPTRDELLAAARDRIRDQGFKAIDREEREEAEDREVFRRIDKSLLKTSARFVRLSPATLELPNTRLPVVQVDLEVGCPWHDMAPRADGSSAIRFASSMGLKAAPNFVRLETIYDPSQLNEVLAVREAITFKQRRAVRRPLLDQGFTPVGEDGRRFSKTERQSRGQLSITVESAGGNVTAEIIFQRGAG